MGRSADLDTVDPPRSKMGVRAADRPTAGPRSAAHLAHRRTRMPVARTWEIGFAERSRAVGGPSSAQTQAYAFARARLFTSAHCESKLPDTAEMAAKEAPEMALGSRQASHPRRQFTQKTQAGNCSLLHTTGTAHDFTSY
jgi:hypothetical protein